MQPHTDKGSHQRSNGDTDSAESLHQVNAQTYVDQSLGNCRNGGKMLLASRKEDECVGVGELPYDVAEYENLKEERTPGRVVMADPKFQERIRPDHERYSDEAEEQHTIARRFDHYVSHLLRGSTGLQRRHGRQDWTEQTADHEQHEVTHRGGDAVVASISEVVVADDHHVQPTDEQVG